MDEKAQEVTHDVAVLAELMRAAGSDQYLHLCIERAKDRVAAQIQFQRQQEEIRSLKQQLNEKPLKAVEEEPRASNDA